MNALESAASLRDFAYRGRLVPEIADESIREVFVYRYRLMYRVRDRSVEIVAFIHSARDFQNWRHDS
jgi:plasmid stabilization system protein ParE